MREHATKDLHPAAVERRIRAQAKLLRQQRNLSLAGLAQRSGLTYAKLYRLETGDGRLLARDLFALAQALRIPIDSFYEPVQQDPQESTPLEQDSRDFLALVHKLDSDQIRHRISRLIRTIANYPATPRANRH